MTPQEHYQAAERLLEAAERDVSENFAVQTGEHKADILAAAQTHALLAVAGVGLFPQERGSAC